MGAGLRKFEYDISLSGEPYANLSVVCVKLSGPPNTGFRSPIKLPLSHMASYASTKINQNVGILSSSIIPAYLISQRCLVEMERRPVALAHVQRDVTGFEGLLHAQLAAAHQPGRYTPARGNGGVRFAKVGVGRAASRTGRLKRILLSRENKPHGYVEIKFHEVRVSVVVK